MGEREVDDAGRGHEKARTGRPRLLEVVVERTGDEVRVVPSGDIDRASAPKLTEALDEAASRQGVRRVTVDLAAVRFLDASAFRRLCGAASKAKRHGFSFAVQRPRKHIHRLFVLTGLTELVE